MPLTLFEFMKQMTRVDQLIDDGYLVRHGDRPLDVGLTNKGLAVLLACADRPQSRGRLDKRVRVPVNHAGKTHNSNPEGKGYEDA